MVASADGIAAAYVTGEATDANAAGVAAAGAGAAVASCSTRKYDDLHVVFVASADAEM